MRTGDRAREIEVLDLLLDVLRRGEELRLPPPQEVAAVQEPTLVNAVEKSAKRATTEFFDPWNKALRANPSQVQALRDRYGRRRVRELPMCSSLQRTLTRGLDLTRCSRILPSVGVLTDHVRGCAHHGCLSVLRRELELIRGSVLGSRRSATSKDLPKEPLRDRKLRKSILELAVLTPKARALFLAGFMKEPRGTILRGKEWIDRANLRPSAVHRAVTKTRAICSTADYEALKELTGSQHSEKLPLVGKVKGGYRRVREPPDLPPELNLQKT